MKNRYKVLIAVAACIAALVAAVGVGSVGISPAAILQILGYKLFGLALPETIDGITVSILWNVRLPRALLAFVVGAALAVSGTVMQSVLKNPLASSYTLGVSSGASLGAALVIIFGLTLPVAGMFTLPLAGTLIGTAVGLSGGSIAGVWILARKMDDTIPAEGVEVPDAETAELPENTAQERTPDTDPADERRDDTNG